MGASGITTLKTMRQSRGVPPPPVSVAIASIRNPASTIHETEGTVGKGRRAQRGEEIAEAAHDQAQVLADQLSASSHGVEEPTEDHADLGEAYVEGGRHRHRVDDLRRPRSERRNSPKQSALLVALVCCTSSNC
jgi:hypothetical protein